MINELLQPPFPHMTLYRKTYPSAPVNNVEAIHSRGI